MDHFAGLEVSVKETSSWSCRSCDSSTRGQKQTKPSALTADRSVIAAAFRHRNLPGKPSLRQYLALHGGQGERHLRRRLRDRVSDFGGRTQLSQMGQEGAPNCPK
jgi:hypothetical protein